MAIYHIIQPFFTSIYICQFHRLPTPSHLICCSLYPEKDRPSHLDSSLCTKASTRRVDPTGRTPKGISITPQKLAQKVRDSPTFKLVQLSLTTNMGLIPTMSPVIHWCYIGAP